MQNKIQVSQEKLIINLIKISFIYNMIQEGWKFNLISDKVFEFKKSRKTLNDIELSDILDKI